MSCQELTMASTHINAKGTGTKSPTKKPSGGPTGLGNSHKSYQPVLPCGNKFLQRKWDQTYYNEHRRMVRDAKPTVDTRAPPTRGHVTTKLKKKQLERERNDVIDRDNLTLLKKMQHIMKTEGQIDHKNTYKHHSLNERHRQVELERIAKENRQMLKRLEDVEPMYKVTDWIDDWRRKEELTEMITAFPEATRMESEKKKQSESTVLKEPVGDETTEVVTVEVEAKTDSDAPPKEADAES